MHPVACAGNLHHPPIPDGCGAIVGVRIGHPAFQSPKEQDRAGDFGIDGALIVDVVAKGRQGAHEVVEFPAQRAIGVPVCAVQREMARYFIGQVRIRFFHTGDRGFQIRIGVRLAMFDLADSFDPGAHAFRGGTVNVVGGGQSQAFDRDGFDHAVRIESRIEQRQDSAERMSDQVDGARRPEHPPASPGRAHARGCCRPLRAPRRCCRARADPWHKRGSAHGASEPPNPNCARGPGRRALRAADGLPFCPQSQNCSLRRWE